MTSLGIFGSLLDLTVIAVWVYVVYEFLVVSNEIYGGRFTTSLPYFIAGYTAFMIDRIIWPIYDNFLITTAEYLPTAIFSLQVVQVVGGIMLVQAFREVYLMNYGSEGFEEVLEDG